MNLKYQNCKSLLIYLSERKSQAAFGSSLLLAVGVGLLLNGCIPYTLGTTARPLKPGEIQSSSSIYFIPNGIELFDTTSVTFIGMGLQIRRGLNDRAEIGVRFPGLAGAVMTYKHLLVGDQESTGALAVMVGAGFVNAGEHAHVEASLIASGSEESWMTPYGGLRLMQVVPISEHAVTDSPTAGAIFGVRIGTAEFGVSPEIGLFYDKSALGLRDHDFIVVPSITLHGQKLLELLRRPKW